MRKLSDLSLKEKEAILEIVNTHQEQIMKSVDALYQVAQGKVKNPGAIVLQSTAGGIGFFVQVICEELQFAVSNGRIPYANSPKVIAAGKETE